MLMLIFEVGEQQFALSTNCVMEVLPALQLQHVHGTSEAIAGLFNYQGKIVPVISMNQVLNEPAPIVSNLKQRIILIRQSTAEDQEKIFGLLVENIIETTSTVIADSVSNNHLGDLFQQPYLGETFLKQNNILQQLMPDNMLSDQEYHELISDVELNE